MHRGVDIVGYAHDVNPRNTICLGQTGDDSHMSCYCNAGWVCEAHPEKPMGHNGCLELGEPCTNPHCRHGRHHLERETSDRQRLRNETEKERPH